MVSRIRRYAQIVDVLSKYGFNIGLERLFPGRARFRLPEQENKPIPPQFMSVYGLLLKKWTDICEVRADNEHENRTAPSGN